MSLEEGVLCTFPRTRNRSIEILPSSFLRGKFESKMNYTEILSRNFYKQFDVAYHYKGLVRRRCKGAAVARQFEISILEFDRVEDAGDFLLRDTNVCLGNLNARVLEYLVEQDEAFSAVIMSIIHVASKRLSEGMRREVRYAQLIFVLQVLQNLVDILDGHRFISTAAWEDIVFAVRTIQQLIKLSEFLLDGWVERNVSSLPSLLFCYINRSLVENVVPSKIKNI